MIKKALSAAFETTVTATPRCRILPGEKKEPANASTPGKPVTCEYPASP
ncbi:hypothetical protein [Amycolatopsis echigonensis]|uniref:Uncharacterized protein n=1 Tax=Amycolatopsis echigonensis TaxID=2576905 RepID=A0A8E1VQC8_9PSEU|nr:hypothetical protein [Amycolatopsis echigonensis]MBB2497570.1 hypothetical protein [Amycolatopsis echigonensis]